MVITISWMLWIAFAVLAPMNEVQNAETRAQAGACDVELLFRTEVRKEDRNLGRPRIVGRNTGKIYVIGPVYLERWGQDARELWKPSDGLEWFEKGGHHLHEYDFQNASMMRRVIIPLLEQVEESVRRRKKLPETITHYLPAGTYRWWIQYLNERPTKDNVFRLTPCVAESNWFEVREDMYFYVVEAR